MGASQSYSSSDQRAEAFISQQFYGSCDITCTNIQQGINIDIINSIVGGSINLTQSCSVNANCMISNSSDATSDVILKATNSSNAKNANNLFSGDLFNINSAYSLSRQDIKQTIIQSTTQSCKLASLNQMNDISILAANSVIGGDINIGQTGTTAGKCQFQNNMSAAATASAMATNTAQSGKDKKGQKKGGSAVIITIGIIVALIVIVYIIAKMYTGNRDTSILTAKERKIAMAKAMAGCPGGKEALLDPDTGYPLIDPITQKPVCPPLDF